MLELLDASPAEPILKLIAEHRNDPRKEKVDLGVGVYRDEQGATPILSAIKESERWLLDSQSSKAYLGSRGDIRFCKAIENLVFANSTGRNGIYTLQTPGGSGALRVAAGVILRAVPDATIWMSEPTWDNHAPLLGGAGFAIRHYPYYDFERHSICLDRMFAVLGDADAGNLVLLHACCHNPTGMDLSANQWEQVADFLAARKLTPFVDFAYHGFADGIDEDNMPVRLLRERFPEMFVAYSCSKNFGLYRDRVGAISFVSEQADLSVIDAQAQNVVRTMYSMPPDHGSAAVAHVLADESLRAAWENELAGMRDRMQDMRSLLVSALRERASEFDWSHIERARGMFCYLGLSAAQVERLKRDYGVYMVESSRINVCGITTKNVEYLAESIAAVL